MTPETLMERAERLALEALENPRLIDEYLEASAACRRIEWPCNPSRRRNGVKPQNERIVAYMKKKGHITQRDAMIDLSVASLTKRICEIQEAGVKIDKERRTHPVSGQQYTRYSLAKVEA